MATHSNVLAWEIPWMEEPCGLQSTGCKELDTAERLTLPLSHGWLQKKAKGLCPMVQYASWIILVLSPTAFKPKGLSLQSKQVLGNELCDQS